MAVVYLTEPNELGMVAAITDEPCKHCGWPETILHIASVAARATRLRGLRNGR